jgi:D-hydroxyproline dehydrogenase subunit gamma
VSAPVTRVRMRVDGVALEARAGNSVAAVLYEHGMTFRRSVRGEPRAALCGMGICHECRVTIDGVAHRRSCLVEVREGLEVVTDG